MKKVALINAYGDKNIGDAAILNVAIRFVKEVNRRTHISVLCENVVSYSNFISNTKNVTPFQLPYGHAIRGKERIGSLKKIVRFIDIYSRSFYYLLVEKLMSRQLPKNGFYAYLKEIKQADLVVGMGGGYFTTNKPISDYFGLMLSLLPVYVAKWYQKNIVFLPMSFGPYASKMQERVTYKALKNTTVISRDKITLGQIRRNDREGKIQTFYAPDLALFFPDKRPNISKKLKSDYVVLTAREWFADQKKQEAYEVSLTKFVEEAHAKYNLRTVFVPMARNAIEDDDNRVAKRIRSSLKTPNIFDVFKPNSLLHLQDLLADARASVCTRMHSAILSTSVYTPFIAIGYGHKTLGFVKSYGIERWHIDIGKVNFQLLSSKFSQLLFKENYTTFIKVLEAKQREIQEYKKHILTTIEI